MFARICMGAFCSEGMLRIVFFPLHSLFLISIHDTVVLKDTSPTM